jgi:hypothetical protein
MLKLALFLENVAFERTLPLSPQCILASDLPISVSSVPNIRGEPTAEVVGDTLELELEPILEGSLGRLRAATGKNAH